MAADVAVSFWDPCFGLCYMLHGAAIVAVVFFAEVALVPVTCACPDRAMLYTTKDACTVRLWTRTDSKKSLGPYGLPVRIHMGYPV